MVGVQKAVKGLSLNLHVLGGIVRNLAPVLVPLRHRLVPMGICRPMSKACICDALRKLYSKKSLSSREQK